MAENKKVTVKSGDTLSSIAKANNTTVSKILAANPVLKTNPKYNGGSTIFSGTKISIPTATSKTGSAGMGAVGRGEYAGDTAITNAINNQDTGGGDTGGDTGGGGTGGGGAGGGGDIGLGAGGVGPDKAATDALLDQIKILTEQIVNMQTAAAEEAAKPKVVGTRTVRKTGGLVEVVQVMSDGTTGAVLESYKDFGAKESVVRMFQNTGLGETFINQLTGVIDQIYEENIMPTEEQVMNVIYNSDAYKTRFAANEIIKKRMNEGKGRPGDRLLTPAEYVKTEEAYREIMSAADMPTGFYDQPEDFTKFIAELGTSVAEVSERIGIAKQALQNADENIKTALKQYYGWSDNDMVAYLLDPERAFQAVNSRFAFSTEQLKERYAAAEVGGAALRAGITGGATEELSKEIVKAGKQDLAERAFQQTAREQADYQRLMGLYGEQAGVEDLTRETLALTGGAEIGIKTKKLASKERAKFQTQSALDKTSLARSKSADV